MYILDTDHVSVLDRGGFQGQRLLQKLAGVDPAQVAVSIISYEEQMRGWLSYAARASTVEKQLKAYKQLKRQLTNYCAMPILEFDEPAAQEFQRLRKLYSRQGTMDLKIASVALANQARTVDTKPFGFQTNYGFRHRRLDARVAGDVSSTTTHWSVR